MRKRICSSVFIASLVAITALVLSPGHIAAPQAQACKCAMEVTLDPDEACPCPDIMITNLTNLRMGECLTSGGICFPRTSTAKCKVAGTVSETGAGCSGGFVDQPFMMERNCTDQPHTNLYPIPCTGLAGHRHLIQMSCDSCAP